MNIWCTFKDFQIPLSNSYSPKLISFGDELKAGLASKDEMMAAEDSIKHTQGQLEKTTSDLTAAKKVWMRWEWFFLV